MYHKPYLITICPAGDVNVSVKVYGSVLIAEILHLSVNPSMLLGFVKQKTNSTTLPSLKISESPQ